LGLIADPWFEPRDYDEKPAWSHLQRVLPGNLTVALIHLGDLLFKG
jgi:hypothetical protein